MCLNKSILCHFVSSASGLSFFSLVTNALNLQFLGGKTTNEIRFCSPFILFMTYLWSDHKGNKYRYTVYEGNPAIPLPDESCWLYLGDPGQRVYIIPPVNSFSALGSPSKRTYLENLLRESPWRHPNQVLEKSQLFLIWRSSSSTPSVSWMTKLFPLSLRLSSATIQSKANSVTFFWDLVLLLMIDEIWNKDWPVNWELYLSAQKFLHLNKPVRCLKCCKPGST